MLSAFSSASKPATQFPKLNLPITEYPNPSTYESYLQFLKEIRKFKVIPILREKRKPSQEGSVFFASSQSEYEDQVGRPNT
ncbi:hypothetical protein CCACVL1_17499 [Corchorus capsularis]|uniref:Uncharacterized protein n=1 Tax=Corchorus capsularis TaxID=210143 RepID=A0A1R3HRL3_COCAP|nr:hypothetical protein CCACVL1_17499 [Corchorus capsularis]